MKGENDDERRSSKVAPSHEANADGRSKSTYIRFVLRTRYGYRSIGADRATDGKEQVVGIYIKGLTEEQFKLVSWEGVYTALKRQDRIVEVAEPHGRLIDEGVLRQMSSNPKGTKIDRVPTVIDAEGASNADRHNKNQM